MTMNTEHAFKGDVFMAFLEPEQTLSERSAPEPKNLPDSASPDLEDPGAFI